MPSSLPGWHWWQRSRLPVQVDVRNAGLIPECGRSPGGGHDNPLQYSCLENLKDRGAWRAIVHRVARDWSNLTHTLTYIKHTVSAQHLGQSPNREAWKNISLVYWWQFPYVLKWLLPFQVRWQLYALADRIIRQIALRWWKTSKKPLCPKIFCNP